MINPNGHINDTFKGMAADIYKDIFMYFPNEDDGIGSAMYVYVFSIFEHPSTIGPNHADWADELRAAKDTLYQVLSTRGIANCMPVTDESIAVTNFNHMPYHINDHYSDDDDNDDDAGDTRGKKKV
eukprot:m.28007 g.28007  ORF g.28007 m.28007 type:complete len:126 (+) comp14057_c0_seq2:555-932(+)